MKHGRPRKDWYEFAGKKYLLCRSSGDTGWRREHAHRVWQAIASILQGIACLNIGAYAAAGDDTKIRAIYLACGWREP